MHRAAIAELEPWNPPEPSAPPTIEPRPPLPYVQHEVNHAHITAPAPARGATVEEMADRVEHDVLAAGASASEARRLADAVRGFDANHDGRFDDVERKRLLHWAATDPDATPRMAPPPQPHVHRSLWGRFTHAVGDAIHGATRAVADPAMRGVVAAALGPMTLGASVVANAAYGAAQGAASAAGR
jgi:hypothetical protein